jgi:nitrile hydratase
MGAAGAWTIDMSRHGRERVPPAEYLAASYYEIWLKGMERVLVECGLVSAAELAAGHAQDAAKPLPRRLAAAGVPAALAKGTPYDRDASAAARFAVGDAVRARVLNPSGHTRLPRYVRGRTGHVARVHGAHVFPDSNAHGRGEDPQWLYSVAFDAGEVWGADGRAGDEIVLDLWEPYLERA